MKSKRSKGPNGKATRGLKLTPPGRTRIAPGRKPAMMDPISTPVLHIGRAITAMGSVPVLLIEDNRLLLDGLSSVLSAQGLKVIATASNGREALRHVSRLRPHLVLLDATLGDRNSLAIVRALKRVFPEMKLIVMHLLPAQEDIVEFVRAGVSGFIMKDASLADFVSTIRTVADGGSVLPPIITGTVFSHVADHAVTSAKSMVKAAMRMTTRERDVNELIAEGLDNSEIAARLGLSPAAVRSHVHNILEKLALHMRLDVAADTQTRRKVQKSLAARQSGPRIVEQDPDAAPQPKEAP